MPQYGLDEPCRTSGHNSVSSGFSPHLGEHKKLTLLPTSPPCFQARKATHRDVLHGTGEVKAARFGVIVAVSLELQAGIAEDGCVVAPGWFG